MVAIRPPVDRRFLLDPFEPSYCKLTQAQIRWLADEISTDTYVNVMGQYRPEYEVGQLAHDGGVRYDEICRRPGDDELAEAYHAARRAGLWRFDHRWRAAVH